MHGSSRVKATIGSESNNPRLAEESLDIPLPVEDCYHLQRACVRAIDNDVIGKSDYCPKSNGHMRYLGSSGTKRGYLARLLQAATIADSTRFAASTLSSAM